MVGCGDDAAPASMPDAGTDASLATCDYWPFAYVPSSSMRPGLPCLSCHSDAVDDRPSMTVAGTVFATPDAADDCRGVAGVEVIVTDAEGTEHRRVTEAAGNFWLDDALSFPITARVAVEGVERRMEVAVPHGDCNLCHSSEGHMEAPGRIVAPAAAL